MLMESDSPTISVFHFKEEEDFNKKPLSTINTRLYLLLILLQALTFIYLLLLMYNDHFIIFLSLFIVIFLAYLIIFIIYICKIKRESHTNQNNSLINNHNNSKDIGTFFLFSFIFLFFLFVLSLQLLIGFIILTNDREWDSNYHYWPLIFLVFYLHCKIFRTRDKNSPLRILEILISEEVCFDYIDLSTLFLITNQQVFQNNNISSITIVSLVTCLNILIYYKVIILTLIHFPYSYGKIWRILGLKKSDKGNYNLEGFIVSLKRKVNNTSSFINFICLCGRLFLLYYFSSEIEDITICIIIIILIKNLIVSLKWLFEIRNNCRYNENNEQTNNFIDNKNQNIEEQSVNVVKNYSFNDKYIEKDLKVTFLFFKLKIKTIFHFFHILTRVFYFIFIGFTQTLLHMMLANSYNESYTTILMISYVFLIIETINNIAHSIKVYQKANILTDFSEERYFFWGIVLSILCFVGRICLGMLILTEGDGDKSTEIKGLRYIFIIIYIVWFLKGKTIFWFLAVYLGESNFIHNLKYVEKMGICLLKLGNLELETLFDFISCFSFFLHGYETSRLRYFGILGCLIEFLNAVVYMMLGIFIYIFSTNYDNKHLERIKRQIKQLRLFINTIGIIGRMVLKKREYSYIFISKHLIQVIISLEYI